MLAQRAFDTAQWDELQSFSALGHKRGPRCLDTLAIRSSCSTQHPCYCSWRANVFLCGLAEASFDCCVQACMARRGTGTPQLSSWLEAVEHSCELPTCTSTRAISCRRLGVRSGIILAIIASRITVEKDRGGRPSAAAQAWIRALSVLTSGKKYQKSSLYEGNRNCRCIPKRRNTRPKSDEVSYSNNVGMLAVDVVCAERK